MVKRGGQTQAHFACENRKLVAYAAVVVKKKYRLTSLHQLTIPSHVSVYVTSEEKEMMRHANFFTGTSVQAAVHTKPTAQYPPSAKH